MLWVDLVNANLVILKGFILDTDPRPGRNEVPCSEQKSSVLPITAKFYVGARFVRLVYKSIGYLSTKPRIAYRRWAQQTQEMAW